MQVDDIHPLAPDPVELELPHVDPSGDECLVEQSVVGVGTPIGEGRSGKDAHTDKSRASLQRVGVVTVAYASAETLAACLRGLPIEDLHGVVVVDNASPDASAAVAAAVPGVQVVQLAENRGFGGGCNAGVRALGDAELVLFVNPDAVIERDQLLRLIGHLDRHQSCAVVAPRLYREGQPLSSAGREAGLATELRTVVPTQLARFFPQRRLPPTYALTGPVAYVEGACFLVRREALQRVGGFDEAFFLFFEELDLARRLRRQGWTVDLVADASAEHLRAVSRRTLADGGRSQLLRSTVLYLRRRGAWRAKAFVAIAPLCWSLRARMGGLSPDRAADMTRAVKARR
jgi:GT2 family glycosyltransferase